jgi:ATP-binding cassette, subfamily B, bacterial CvaB/MchF/RaxB
MKLAELPNLLKFSWNKKLPMMFQTEVAECGLACLAMIATYYGYNTDLLSLRRIFSISLKGSKLKDLMDLGSRLNLSSRALKLELEDIKYLKTPCILHWDLDHFVVLRKLQRNTAIIHDPAIGIIKIKLVDLSSHFTGVALELTPMINFEKKENKTKLNLSDLFNAFIGIKTQLFQILLTSLALETFGIVIPLFVQLITDNVIVTKDLPLLYLLSMGFGLLIITQVITSSIRSWMIVFISNTINIQLVANLINHLLKLPLDFFEKRHMGDIASRFESISTIQDKLSTDFVIGIVDGFMIIITLIMMLIYSPLLSIVIITALILYVIVRILLYSYMKYQTQELIIRSAKEQSIFMESIRAILPIKVFGKETQRENIWLNAYADKLNAGIGLSKLKLLYSLIMQLIFTFEYITVVALASKLVIDGNAFSIGMLISYLSYRQQFVTKSQNFIEKIIEFQMIKIHLERVADIVLTETEKDIAESSAIKEIEGNIKVENLSFRYSEQDPYIFKDINFTLLKRQVLAIAGPSGSGKTTLMKVMLNLLSPTSGCVLVDDVNINKLGRRAYRSQVAAVMQDDVLMSGSIAANISFFDSNPDLAFVHQCAMTAVIHDEIIKMPMGYNSLVGDMGTNLSGGQKQRILLARALYSKPKILFLDESTSNLDFNNEAIVNQHIKKLGITRIIISHRNEVLEQADKIIYLKI